MRSSGEDRPTAACLWCRWTSGEDRPTVACHWGQATYCLSLLAFREEIPQGGKLLGSRLVVGKELDDLLVCPALCPELVVRQARYEDVLAQRHVEEPVVISAGRRHGCHGSSGGETQEGRGVVPVTALEPAQRAHANHDGRRCLGRNCLGALQILASC